MLTDAPSFQGAPEFLTAARAADEAAGAAQGFHVRALPGVRGARLGRRRILIIMASVDDDDAQRAGRRRRSSSAWTCWSRCTTRPRLERALKLSSRLIGINNRDLRTFESSLETSERLAKLVPADRLLVGESGIFTHDDCLRLARRRHRHLPGRRKPDAAGRRAAATRALLTGAPAAVRGRPWLTQDAGLTHLGADGEADMVDVGGKAETERTAIAEGIVTMRPRRCA